MRFKQEFWHFLIEHPQLVGIGKKSLEKDMYAKIKNIIRSHSQFLRYAADAEREVEIMTGNKNAFRDVHLYYDVTKILQEVEDDDFASLYPPYFNKVEKQFGPAEIRWQQAIELAQQMSQGLRGNTSSEAIIDCRGKGIFSIWGKRNRYDVDPDEIFDLIGVRITTKDLDTAWQVKDYLHANYELMRPHHFRKIDQIHQPVRGSTNIPNKLGFAAQRMNFVTPNGIAEVQLSTKDAFIAMHQGEQIISAIGDYK